MEWSAQDVSILQDGEEVLLGASMRFETRMLVGVLSEDPTTTTSALLYALAGFRPTSPDEVQVDGRSVYEGFEELKSKIGFVPHQSTLPSSLSVERNLQYLADLRLLRQSPSNRQERMEAVLGDLGLVARRTRRVRDLAPEERLLVHVAAELLLEPDVLYLERPLRALTQGVQETILRTLQTLVQSADLCIVLGLEGDSPLHTLDRLWVLHDRHLAFEGPPATAPPPLLQGVRNTLDAS